MVQKTYTDCDYIRGIFRGTAIIYFQCLKTILGARNLRSVRYKQL